MTTFLKGVIEERWGGGEEGSFLENCVCALRREGEECEIASGPSYFATRCRLLSQEARSSCGLPKKSILVTDTVFAFLIRRSSPRRCADMAARRLCRL